MQEIDMEKRGGEQAPQLRSLPKFDIRGIQPGIHFIGKASHSPVLAALSTINAMVMPGKDDLP